MYPCSHNTSICKRNMQHRYKKMIFYEAMHIVLKRHGAKSKHENYGTLI